MKPILVVQSDTNDSFLESLVASIASIDCAEHFTNHLGHSQTQQATAVQGFQRTVRHSLTTAFPPVTWHLEYQPAAGRDSVDIFGQVNNASVVIELDKTRADQVAKKFLSRSAMFAEMIYYISLCYPGTDHMSPRECRKYFEYCASLSKRLGNLYAGFIIQRL